MDLKNCHAAPSSLPRFTFNDNLEQQHMVSETALHSSDITDACVTCIFIFEMVSANWLYNLKYYYTVQRHLMNPHFKLNLKHIQNGLAIS